MIDSRQQTVDEGDSFAPDPAGAMTAEEKAAPRIDYDARPLYRVTFPIAYGKTVIGAGSLHRLEKCTPEAIERLTARGTIVEVNAPPLEVLPGWSRRATRLEKAGITNVVHFLGADAGQVADYMRVRPETVTKWQSEALAWLQPGKAR